MKRFLKMVGIWLAILLLLAIGADYTISKGLRKTDLRKYAVWNDIFSSKVDADLLVLGSSETWCGYDTYVFDSLLDCNSYNMGIVGHRFKYLFLRYKTYQRYSPKPKAIVINLALVDAFGDEENQYEKEQFYPYFYDKVFVDELASVQNFSMLERYVPFYRYFGNREDIESGFLSFFGKTDFFDGGMHKGYRPYLGPWSPESLDMDTVFEAPVNSEIICELNAFIHDRREEGIKVVMVNFPEYHLLRDKFSNTKEIDSIFYSFAENNQVPYLDFSQAEFSFDSTCYFNPSHLNKKGAELFTSLLCHKLDSLHFLDNVE